MTLEGTLYVTVKNQVAQFEFTVTNAGTEPVEIQFRSGKVADVAAYDDGVEVWRWSDGRLFSQALETQTLAPGESFTHEATWDDPPAGEYTAEASLDAANIALVERESFSVS